MSRGCSAWVVIFRTCIPYVLWYIVCAKIQIFLCLANIMNGFCSLFFLAGNSKYSDYSEYPMLCGCNFVNNLRQECSWRFCCQNCRRPILASLIFVATRQSSSKLDSALAAPKIQSSIFNKSMPFPSDGDSGGTGRR